MSKIKRYLLIGITVALTSFAVIGCSKNDTAKPTAHIKIKDYGTIVAELYPEQAPNTVNNFIELSKKGFYNNLTIHRAVRNFVIQGGDPEGTGTGGPGYSIKGEFSKNGFKENTISHKVGTLSMARSTDNDSAGSQFFIVTGDAEYLDGEYAGFGKVTEGLDIVDKIDDVEVDENDKPLKDVIIESITIENNGYKHSKPDKIK